MPSPHEAERASRRRFLGSGVAASLAAGTMVHSSIAAERPRELRLGIIGCGSRGTNALKDTFSINEGVTLVAAADLYREKCLALPESLEQFAERIALTDERMHGGLDGYRRVLDDPGVDVVLVTAAPGFCPRYVLAAVEAGKHVFAEKPVCVDPAGYRICLAAHDKAVANRTAIVTGTQYRRQTSFIEAISRIHDGAIGRVIGATTRYCATGIWYRPRREGMSDAEYQMNNWMHFIWLSGDQICEQAIHNIDVVNWVMAANPVAAFGSGGRFTRPDDSEMWDSFSIDYEYPDDRVVSFKCRQIPGTAGEVGTVVYGSAGRCHIGAGNTVSRIVDHSGQVTWEMKGDLAAAYRQEHGDLVDSIRAGRPIVELKQTADSSLAGVMGRLAAYTGQRVGWEFVAAESKLDLFPPHLAWDAALPPPQHAVPGRTPLV